MNIEDLMTITLRILRSKEFFLSFGLIAILIAFVQYAASQPQSYDKFLSIDLLGNNMTVGHYFPHDETTIQLGQQTTWFASVHNNMFQAKYLSVRMKILDSIEGGSSGDGVLDPHAGSQIWDTQFMLTHNSTRIIPITWSISQARHVGNYVEISGINVNGNVTANMSSKALYGKDFRMALELWVYDESQGKFVFNESTNLDASSSWDQIWFSIKA